MSDFKHEFNDGGTWRPALIVESSDENNVYLAYLSTDDGSWHTASASRGEESGEFRNKS